MVKKANGLTSYIEEDPDYMEMDPNDKRKRVRKVVIRSLRFIATVLYLYFINTLFVYGYIMTANMLSSMIGDRVPIDETQVLTVSFELLNLLKPTVLIFLVISLVALGILKRFSSIEGLDTWLWIKRALIFSYLAPNTMLLLGVVNYKMDAVWWLFKTSLSSPLI